MPHILPHYLRMFFLEHFRPYLLTITGLSKSQSEIIIKIIASYRARCAAGLTRLGHNAALSAGGSTDSQERPGLFCLRRCQATLDCFCSALSSRTRKQYTGQQLQSRMQNFRNSPSVGILNLPERYPLQYPAMA